MTTSVAKIPLRQVQDVRSLLQNDQARQQLAMVAAKHMSPERLMRVTANAIRTTPKLQNVDPLSFLGALMQSAALGLEPNTVLGHSFLVPFDKNVKDPETGRWQKIPQVQLIIGYKGLIDLARRSGHITSISAHVHYSDDELWEYEEGTEARLRHRPGPQEGEKLHAYAIAKFRDSGHAYVVLPWSHVIKIRNGAQGWQSAVKLGKTESSPWFTHEDAMAKKTAIRALAKYLPLSVDFMDAVQIDHDHGATVDYAKMALNPKDGPQFDGVTIDGEAETPDDNLMDDSNLAKEKDEPAEEEKPKAKPAAKAKDEAPKKEEPAKAEKKAEAPAPKEDPKPAAPSDEEMMNKIIALIKKEIDAAEDAGEIEAVLEMYGDQREQLSDEQKAEIDEYADERREAVAA